MSGQGIRMGYDKFSPETFTDKVIICLTTYFGAFSKMCQTALCNLSEAFLSKDRHKSSIPCCAFVSVKLEYKSCREADVTEFNRR